jgi:hypothetical protein
MNTHNFDITARNLINKLNMMHFSEGDMDSDDDTELINEYININSAS